MGFATKLHAHAHGRPDSSAPHPPAAPRSRTHGGHRVMTDKLSAEEIAAIKAENSRRHSAALTTRNLVWALVATRIVVMCVVLCVVVADEAGEDGCE